ncbi:MAG: helix-turn-helix domain-containing protein [Planctomycetota bacterium]|jgi:predicted transcriptional regulator
MDFITAGKLGNLLARDYAESAMELLVNYRSLSASEVASRLSLHIRTAQDFLDGLAGLGLVDKEEVFENKRPYFRYTLTSDRITMDIDLSKLRRTSEDQHAERAIREKAESGARFVTARSGQSISAVIIWTGRGRDRKERRINLTDPQGRFLFQLPFPDAPPQTLSEIMSGASVTHEYRSEILDLIELLEREDVIETTEF